MLNLSLPHLYVTLRNEDGLTHVQRFQDRAALYAHVSQVSRLQVVRVEHIDPTASHELAVRALASAWAPRHGLRQEEATVVVAPQPLVRPMTFWRFVLYALGFLGVLGLGIMLAIRLAYSAMAWLA